MSGFERYRSSENKRARRYNGHFERYGDFEYIYSYATQDSLFHAESDALVSAGFCCLLLGEQSFYAPTKQFLLIT